MSIWVDNCFTRARGTIWLVDRASADLNRWAWLGICLSLNEQVGREWNADYLTKTRGEETAMSEQRDQFQKLVGALVKQVQEWVEPHEWVTKPYPKKMRDVDRQVFEVPALFLQKGPTRILLDPVAYDVPGSEGVVDLYLMPTYDDLASLHLVNGEWVIHYAFPPDSMGTQAGSETEALPLSETTINQVLNSIADHAVPSF